MPITAVQRESRKNHLGSSDMAAILGLDKYRNAYDVWLEKTGKLADQTETQAMMAGTMFEDGVLQYAERELGKLTRNQYRSVKSEGIPLGAHIDALLVESGIPVEAKTAGLFGPLQDIWGAEGTDEVPDRVIIQVHVGMLCTGKELCHVPAFLGGRGFAMFIVPRDKIISEVVTEAAVEFWDKNVLADTPPDNTLPHAASIKRIRREPATITELDQKLVDQWLTAKSDLKQIEAAKDAAELAMLTALGQAEGGLTPDGILTYLSQLRATVDGKTLKTEHPEIYEQYSKTSRFRVARWKRWNKTK